MNCYNLARPEAQAVRKPLSPNEYAWITIQEPYNQHIYNEHLDKLNTLKMKFWDVVEPVPIVGSDEIAQPPSEEEAKQIVDFILANKDKHIIVNCKAGSSRSGCICYFLEEYLRYEWMNDFKARAVPNYHLYSLLVKYYTSLGYPKPVKIIDRRRNQLIISNYNEH